VVLVVCRCTPVELEVEALGKGERSIRTVLACNCRNCRSLGQNRGMEQDSREITLRHGNLPKQKGPSPNRVGNSEWSRLKHRLLFSRVASKNTEMSIYNSEPYQ
jgi:hypothetical protein